MVVEDVLGSASPNPGTTDSLAYYKAQYEQLEAELADFQASSKELEAHLEQDVEAAEKRERELRLKVESLTYEVDEWKMKYKQAKSESNAAQTTLQKEITGLRESQRTLQSQLRDIEVSNDDMERQARNTSSSLEDLESKYNVAIERGVLAEEEIKNGEQEREALRIETQRLRDELSDLRIEAEIRQDKLHNAHAMIERLNQGEPSPVNADLSRPQSALSEVSPTTSATSPTIATPPTKSASSTVSEMQTPPSPPTSEKSNTYIKAATAPKPAKSRSRPSDISITPRPLASSSRLQRYSRGPSISANTERTPHQTQQRSVKQPPSSQRPGGLVQSGSLYHLHGLMNKMHNLEQRVHSVRSKLPAPTSTPPRASPRGVSGTGPTAIPSNVTMRSNKKRSGGSNVSSMNTLPDRPSSRLSSTVGSTHHRPASRLSSGIPQPSPSREPDYARPPSRDVHSSRPSSRASLSSRQSIGHISKASFSSSMRPESRQSLSGSRTPMGQNSAMPHTEPRRPRSSLGGSYGASDSQHYFSSSVSRGSHYGSLQHTEEEPDEVVTPTPSRRSTFNTDSVSSIPSLSASKSRISMPGKRNVSGMGEMGPPDRKPGRKLSEVGESY